MTNCKSKDVEKIGKFRKIMTKCENGFKVEKCWQKFENSNNFDTVERCRKSRNWVTMWEKLKNGEKLE